ncbi:MAG: hypothetical protein WBN59_04990 [Flavobacteriaceae bacterium]
MAYRILLGGCSQRALFLAPFGYEVVRNTLEESLMARTSYELGISYYLQANYWIIVVPRIGMMGFYGDRDLSVNFGLSVMFRGKRKEKTD